MFSICVWVILLTRNSSNCFNQRNPIIIPTILVGVDFESSHDLGSLKCFPMLQVEITSVIMLHTSVLTCSEESEGCSNSSPHSSQSLSSPPPLVLFSRIKIIKCYFESKQLDKQDQRLRHSGEKWLSKNDHKGTFWSLGCETPQLKSLKN